MQKMLSYMLLGAMLVGSVVCWPIELGQADEIIKSPIQQMKQEPVVISNLVSNNSGSIAGSAVRNLEANYVTRGETAERLVDALDLNLDAYRFFKAPEVVDFFDDVSIDASYAKAVMILGYNGAVGTSERSFRPLDNICRDEMAQILASLLRQKSREPLIAKEINPVSIKDLAQARPEVANDILIVIKSDIMTLQEGKFQPGRFVTQREFEVIVKKISSLIKTNAEGVNARIIVNKEGNREIELTWGEKPSSGYEVRIENLVLEENTLLVLFSTQEPTPGSYNSTVITEPKDIKPLPANYPANLTIRLQKI